MNEARCPARSRRAKREDEVRSVGPRNGPQLVVHPNLRKEVGVSKWLEHRAVQLSCEIDITRAPIVEADP
jgi:hypothetical protein